MCASIKIQPVAQFGHFVGGIETFTPPASNSPKKRNWLIP